MILPFLRGTTDLGFGRYYRFRIYGNRQSASVCCVGIATCEGRRVVMTMMSETGPGMSRIVVFFIT